MTSIVGPAGFAERAVDQLIDFMAGTFNGVPLGPGFDPTGRPGVRGVLNGNIDLVYSTDTETIDKINLQMIPIDHFYVSQGIHPLNPPAVFVFPDRTIHDLTAQNVAAQRHEMIVALVAEDQEIQHLTRKMMRYAKAMWLTLHDQAISDMHVLVRSIDYGPTLDYITEQRATRMFRMDVVLRCEVLHLEPFSLGR